MTQRIVVETPDIPCDHAAGRCSRRFKDFDEMVERGARVLHADNGVNCPALALGGANCFCGMRSRKTLTAALEMEDEK